MPKPVMGFGHGPVPTGIQEITEEAFQYDFLLLGVIFGPARPDTYRMMRPSTTTRPPPRLETI